MMYMPGVKTLVRLVLNKFSGFRSGTSFPKIVKSIRKIMVMITFHTLKIKAGASCIFSF